MERIQIMLEPKDREALQHLAREANTSMSQMVRDFLWEKCNEKRRAKMRRAAEMMAEEYRKDSELTALTALEGSLG